MKQCLQCDFENIRNRFYCERCGTLLPHSTAPTPKKASTSHTTKEYMVPLLEMYTPMLSPLPPPPPPMPDSVVLYSRQNSETPSSHGRALLYTSGRVMLYLIGTLTASFGIFGLLTAFMSEAAGLVGFLFLFINSTIILVLLLMLHQSPYLRWWQRLIGLLATTGIIFVVLLLGAVIVSLQPTNSMKQCADIVYSSIVVAYGIVVAAIALW